MAGSVSIFAEKQFFISPGVPAANCKLSTYLAGTLTFSTTWQDRDQTIANPQPIPLDANGMCTIWLATGISYDMVLRDPTNTTVIETFDDVTGALSSVTSSSSEWVTSGLTATFVNATTFTVAGDHTTAGSKIYERGRRIRTLEGIVNKYGTVISSTFAAGITTVVCNMQAGTSITSGLTTVDYGILSVSSPSSLTGIGSVLNLTGYSGADINLEVGQRAYYDISAVTSLALRIAAADNQIYRIAQNNTIVAGAAGAASQLRLNNVAFAANSFRNIIGYHAATTVGPTTPSGAYTTDTAIFVDAGITTLDFLATVCTRTNGKSCHSSWFSIDATTAFAGFVNSSGFDTTTVITSLGTLIYANPVTGRVMVERVL